MSELLSSNERNDHGTSIFFCGCFVWLDEGGALLGPVLGSSVASFPPEEAHLNVVATRWIEIGYFIFLGFVDSI